MAAFTGAPYGPGPVGQHLSISLESDGPITFDLDSGIKDIRFMLAEAKRRGIELPVLQQTLACYEEARRHGSGAAGLEGSVTGYWPKRGAR